MTKTDIEKILFIDIETVPLVYKYDELDENTKELWNKKWQYNKEVSAEQQYNKAGVYAEFSKVVCIGLGFYNQNKFRVKTISSNNEVDILNQFADLLKSHFNTYSHLLCAHNGKEFDFPFLCRRFLINNLSLPKTLQIQGLKPWEVKHIDTMDLWKFGDVKNFSSLNLLAHVFGIPSPKDEIDGSMVSKTFYEEKNLEKIAKYCQKDVITLARVYNRFVGLGNLPDEDIIFV
ncbi:3'-5' exonuclease [Sediminibacterium sp.]|uniref:3'-5' exonuclease n=1 Tax=Sediminibacterium sp. TaxID=1917865 RepID=UPI002736B09E|nr:3'-5' exonuclease [Sediminibacterium sp.]MDP3567296.1 3'-5' exonuclease [Sediminibacterium sp.]